MFESVGGACGIGGPLPKTIGGESFIRHIGNDKLIFDFKSGSGTTVKDRSREGNDGTFAAGAAAPTWKRNSLYFDGGDYVDLTGISHGISTGGFTICFFVSNPTLYRILFDQQTNRLLVYCAYSDGKIRSLSRQLTDDVLSIKPISCQVTRDKSGNLECYINSAAGNKGQSNAENLAYDEVSSISLGSRYSFNGYFIIATINSFRILNKCLSGIEAQQEYLANKFSNN